MLDFHSFTTSFSATGFAFLKEDLLAFSLAGFSRDLPKTTSAGGWDFIHRRTPWDSSSGHAGLESPKTLLLPSMTSLCSGFKNESGTMPVILVTATGGDEAHGEGLSSRNGDMHGLDLPMPPEHDKKSKWATESGYFSNGSQCSGGKTGKARMEFPFVSMSNIC